MLHSGWMQVETALLFETPEQIYTRVFRALNPRAKIPEILITFKQYANANSRIHLADGRLEVQISDLLQSAPAPVQDALAYILLSKLYRKGIDSKALAVYRRYMNRVDVRRQLRIVKQTRGRKQITEPKGSVYDADLLFDELNLRFFGGMMAKPLLGWSVRPSLTILGHYDPSHHAIVLSSVLDTEEAPEIAVRYVMYHEMLHLRHPEDHRGARRCVHTQAFKAEERLFPQFREAQAALRQFIELKRRSKKT